MSSSLILFSQIKFSDFVETCVPENKVQIMMCFILKTDVNEWVPVGILLMLEIILYFLATTSLNIFHLLGTVLSLLSP